MPLTDEDRKRIRELQAPKLERTADFQPRSIDAYRNGLISQSAGCHPSQVAEFNQNLEDAKITESRFLADGSLRFASRKDRKEICKMWGYVDRDASYGDAM